MKNLPNISIVIPVYNGADYLDGCLQSLVDEDYPDLEIIVCDAGSKDGTVDIIKKFEDHITWWVSEPDQGQSDAINKGFARPPQSGSRPMPPAQRSAPIPTKPTRGYPRKPHQRHPVFYPGTS